jgi:peptide deformylase
MKLPIAKYGDPILRAKGKRVEKIDDEIRDLAFNMLETMHAANGVGLAAQQIGRPLQLTVLDISQVEDRPSTMKLNGKEVDPIASMPLILINPELELGEEEILGSEGCLSIPDINADVLRSFSVITRAQTLDESKSKRLACSRVRCNTSSIILTAFFSSIASVPRRRRAWRVD